MKRLDNVGKKAAEKEERLHMAKTKEANWLALRNSSKQLRKGEVAHKEEADDEAAWTSARPGINQHRSTLLKNKSWRK